MAPIHFAVSGDLIRSKEIRQRGRIAREIERALETVNARFEWEAGMVTTRGLDEVSGVLASPDQTFDVLVALNLELWPNRFRFALGAGEIDVAVGSGDAAAMDGSAFHRAAEAMVRARKDGLPFAMSMAGLSKVDRALLESAALLHADIMEMWTTRVYDFIWSYLREGKQRLVAEEFGTTQQAVSDALGRGRLRELRATEKAIREWLEAYGRRTAGNDTDSMD